MSTASPSTTQTSTPPPQPLPIEKSGDQVAQTSKQNAESSTKSSSDSGKENKEKGNEENGSEEKRNEEKLFDSEETTPSQSESNLEEEGKEKDEKKEFKNQVDPAKEKRASADRARNFMIGMVIAVIIIFIIAVIALVFVFLPKEVGVPSDLNTETLTTNKVNTQDLTTGTLSAGFGTGTSGNPINFNTGENGGLGINSTSGQVLWNCAPASPDNTKLVTVAQSGFASKIQLQNGNLLFQQASYDAKAGDTVEVADHFVSYANGTFTIPGQSNAVIEFTPNPALSIKPNTETRIPFNKGSWTADWDFNSDNGELKLLGPTGQFTITYQLVWDETSQSRSSGTRQSWAWGNVNGGWNFARGWQNMNPANTGSTIASGADNWTLGQGTIIKLTAIQSSTVAVNIPYAKLQISRLA